jgi:hypothetical protein
MKKFGLFLPVLSVIASPAMASNAANTTAMMSLLNSAKGGEVINLADGRYSLNLSNKVYASPVTVQGSAKAVFSPFAKINGVTNLTIKGVTFAGSPNQPDGTYLLKPENTTNLSLIGVHFAGVGQSMVGIYPKTGVNRNFLLDSCTVSNLADGLFLSNMNGALVNNCVFTGLGADTMKIMGGKNITISNNHVYGAIHNAYSHPDFLQLQGNNYNITVKYNLIENATQGIDNFGFDKGYTNQTIVVTYNTMKQANYPNFIGLNNLSGNSVVANNTVYKGTGGYPLIRTSGTVAVYGNVIK